MKQKAAYYKKTNLTIWLIWSLQKKAFENVGNKTKEDTLQYPKTG